MFWGSALSSSNLESLKQTSGTERVSEPGEGVRVGVLVYGLGGRFGSRQKIGSRRNTWYP